MSGMRSKAHMSSKTQLLTIRVSNKCLSEYQRLVETSASNPHKSARTMIQWVVEWYPFRHSTRKYRQRRCWQCGNKFRTDLRLTPPPKDQRICPECTSDNKVAIMVANDVGNWDSFKK